MSAVHNFIAWPDKYRGQRETCGPELSGELEQISADINDPVLKLKFLRDAIDRHDNCERRVRWLPFPRVRRALYRLYGLEALMPAATHVDDESRAIIHARTADAHTQVRRWMFGGVAGALFLVPIMLAGLALQMGGRQKSVAVAAIAPVPDAAPPIVSVAQPAATQEDAPLGDSLPLVMAESLPEETLGQTPSTIFLADRGSDWEVYSNGLRIETAYTVRGEPRRYKVADRQTGLQSAILTQPGGILFHTSESDLWPLEADYGKKLRTSSKALLKFVQRNKAYNYLIDRFGRVYRIVADETRASHAGHSVWARADEVYLDLNSAFIGVSFESRWQSTDGGALPITRAQLMAGRNLTNYLRQRFAIAPEMCVTHGLTSVAPRQHLIGYHRDWARGFPFAAFGLPDQYAEPPPSMTLFGFSYDVEFLRAVGELTPGVVIAEQMMMAEAKARDISLEALRNERRVVYETWRKQLRGDDGAPAGEAPNQQIAIN